MTGSRMLAIILATASFVAIGPVHSQTVPAAYRGRLPFTIGGGASNFNVDWNRSRMFGYSIWGDWHPGTLPRLLDGLGVEIQGRDLDFYRTNVSPGFRQDTFGAGPTYSYRRFARIRPYGKFLIEYGRLNYGPNQVATDKVYAPAFGFEYHAIQRLWVRADYEYQMWPNLLNGKVAGSEGKTLDPQGFTLGVSYDFRSIRFFR
jgi:opacity protein-like surface antigen